ncbi:DNA polymerase III subunit epsilon [Ktedonobacteria bacterium brp13]|nr:DNA polymerase III subunit epsilon [Ktedonobacteria bacterium brp13]
MNVTERNTWLRNHHYRWRKNLSGQWMLIGPDGYPTTEQAARKAIEQQHKSLPLSPQQWARSMLEKRPLILDTETSGLEASHEVIELALVEIDGTVVLNTLIQCQGEIPADATRIHGITKTMLSSAPAFPEIWTSLTSYRDREIIIYNAAFDISLLTQTATRYQMTLPRLKSHCLMIQYLAYVAGAQTNGKSRESYHSLETACHQFGVVAGGHRALSDAQAAREVLCHLAEGL